MSDELPISKRECLAAAAWLKGCFGEEIAASVFKPFTTDHIVGIACQETAYFWLGLIHKLTPAEILAACVLDGSGDVAGTTRSAYPKNTAAFIRMSGRELADILVVEGNKSRAIRGLNPWGKLYKGYGIFQYDLQFVLEDEVFFRNLQWHDFKACLQRCLMELQRAYANHGDVRTAIRAYNGSGKAAEQYASNVLQFADWSATV